MLRTISWYSSFLWRLRKSKPQLEIAEKLYAEGKIDEARAIAFKESSEFARVSIEKANCNVTVEGLENIPDGPVLYVSNHQSNFDIAVIMYYINKPKGFIAKEELKKLDTLKRWMDLLGCVFMDRSTPKKSLAAIIEGTKILKSGYSLVICPEGTRSKSNVMGEFKAGSFKLATKSKVPIVPVTIDGTYKAMEANKNMIKPAEIKLFVHKPIYTANLTKEEEANLPTLVKNIIAEKL